MEYEWNDLQELRAKLLDMLETVHGDQVTALVLSLEGDTVVLKGEVASEQVKSDAKRFAFGFEGVLKVRNELEVAGYFFAASDPLDDDYFGPGAGGSCDGGDDAGLDVNGGEGNADGGADGGIYRGLPGPRVRSSGAFRQPEGASLAEATVVRHPTVEAVGEFIPSSVVELTIDLLEDAQSDLAPLVIGSFPSDWSSIDVTVQVFAPWAGEMVALSPSVRLTRKGSQPARFRLVVRDDYVSGSAAPIHVSFLSGTRVCGHLSRDLTAAIAVPVEAAPAPPAALPDVVGSSPVRVVPTASGPTLSVTILAQAAGVQTWMWKGYVPKLLLDGSAQIQHRSGEAEFAEELLASCPDLRPDEFRRAMAGIGERIWQATPEEFRRDYLRCRKALGVGFPIQFITGDPYVPWEMMKPDVDDLDADHLFLDHPVCRWPVNVAGGRTVDLLDADRLSFVPTYTDGDDLPSARAEGEWLEDALGAVRMTADRRTFLHVLDGKHDGRVGLLHFAGHGRADHGIKDGGIRMEDRWIGVNDIYQSQVQLGVKDAPLVVLNACESGSGEKFLGMNTGWGMAIAARGFGGLIAPLWEVHDDVAFDLIKTALEPLANGRSSLGEALADARRNNRDRSISAFAYLAHGDVMARFPARR